MFDITNTWRCAQRSLWTNSTCEKLLGINFDQKLTFDDYIFELCKKASRKIHAIVRVTPQMDLSKERIFMNAFCNSQFSYCPLVWMSHSRANNSKINRLHERCLKITYFDKQPSNEALLEKDDLSLHSQQKLFKSLPLKCIK